MYSWIQRNKTVHDILTTGGRTAKGIRTANGIHSNMARKYCVILGTINPTLAYLFTRY